jgi:hypothetical protein
MYNKVRRALLLVLIATLIAQQAYAQEGRPTPTSVPRGEADQGGQPLPPPAALSDLSHGSIRGTVRLDTNGDGRCATGPVVADIPIQFVSDDGRTTLFLRSGDNGTYGLVAAGFGTWRVSADPPAPYVVTSAKTVNAFLGENQRLALGVDFCVADIVNVRAQAPVILPQSGAPIAPPLAAAGVAGLTLLLSGLALEWRRRSSRP